MHSDFWLERWQQGQIGFHQAHINALLLRHWPTLGVVAGASVLVPLCGKSLDLRWLAEQGHRVVGVEVSPLACAAFFADQGWQAALEPFDRGVRYRGQGPAAAIELWCCDWFGLTPGDLGPIDAFYDRGSLIALPEPTRRQHALQLARLLSADATGLLITLDYPQAERAGPPFAVPAAEVMALFGEAWRVQSLEAEDMLARPDARERQWGLSRVQQLAWSLARPAPANRGHQG
jgi:thiopurine S-methyltransferase